MNSCTLSPAEQAKLIEKLNIFTIQGRDRSGRPLLCITGKLFPARMVSSEAVKKYLDDNVFPRLNGRPFSVVYLHTGVQLCENFPGISTLQSIHDAVPINVKNNLSTIYYVHPGLQSRLFIATFGRLFFSQGLYSKVQYVNRLEFLWKHVRRNEMEIPEYVYDHDEALDECSDMEYGLESDHPRKNYYSTGCRGFGFYVLHEVYCLEKWQTGKGVIFYV